MEEEHQDESFPSLVEVQASSPSSPPPQLPQMAEAPRCQLILARDQRQYQFQSQIRSLIDPQESYSSPH